MHAEAQVAQPAVHTSAATGRFRALGHDFALRGSDPELIAYVADLYALLAADGEPAAWYELTRPGEQHELTFDGKQLVRASAPADVIGMLIWHVNRQAVERSCDLVRLHAAVASRGGEAVLLPAAMEAGKTTLVAGLVRAGLDYLSDEIGALDPDSLEIVAYPKALSVDEGSWGVLADLEPVVDGHLAGRLPHQWQVRATAIRPHTVPPLARPRFVVFPHYEPDAPSAVTPLRKADATVRLARCTFDFEQQPERDLPALGRLAECTDCYDLQVGDLESACRLVLDLYDRDE